VKLNCDLGESYGIWKIGLDDAVMPHIDMANIACGFHASDPDVMAKTIQSAQHHQVAIGAHPGYDDKKGFGRRSIPHSKDELKNLVIYQVGAIQGMCNLYGAKVEYIKPHGALYNDMMRDEMVFQAIVESISQAQLNLPLMILARGDNRAYQAIADEYAVPLLFEAFADRAYTVDGNLAARSQIGAVYHHSTQIIKQVQQLVEEGTVTAIDGQKLRLNADTICVHGDNQEAVAIIKQIRKVLG
jgi:5-oxoprolinase (ATP-hydrolysing) subunit A